MPRSVLRIVSSVVEPVANPAREGPLPTVHSVIQSPVFVREQILRERDQERGSGFPRHHADNSNRILDWMVQRRHHNPQLKPSGGLWPSDGRLFDGGRDADTQHLFRPRNKSLVRVYQLFRGVVWDCWGTGLFRDRQRMPLYFGRGAVRHGIRNLSAGPSDA